MPGIELRDYQRECVAAIDALEGGAHLVHMATGLGKTVTFTSIARRGKVLVLSHRDELVHQPVKYYDCPVGIERAEEVSPGEEVVSASVQTLSHEARLGKFEAGEFDTVITDEAHHALAPTYRRIVDHLKPRLHLGFTAMPSRGDQKGLDKVFDDIVFSRDLRWGIRNGWLVDIDCRRVVVGWDTSRVRRSKGDYAYAELEAQVNTPTTNEQIAAAYEEFRVGQTIVFANSVDHAYELAGLIGGAEVVVGKTPIDERRAILEAFRRREVPCIVNCGVLTEGADLPLVETILLARPTQSPTLYNQMVGRGVRLSPGKRSLRLIDCVGVTEDRRLCTAPTLFGLDVGDFPKGYRSALDGSLMGLEDRLLELEDTPEGWVLRSRKVDVLGTSSLAWIVGIDGSASMSGTGWRVVRRGPDDLGGYDVTYTGRQTSTRHYRDRGKADDRVREWLQANPASVNESYIWDSETASRWANAPVSAKQLDFVSALMEEVDPRLEWPESMETKRDAQCVIARLQDMADEKRASKYGRCPLCGTALRLSRKGTSVVCGSNRYRTVDGRTCLVSGDGFVLSRMLEGAKVPVARVKEIVETGSTTVGGRPAYLWRRGTGDDARYSIERSEPDMAYGPVRPEDVE